MTATKADPGPPVLKDRRPVRMAIGVVTNTLAYIPYLPYQFIFKLEHAALTSRSAMNVGRRESNS